MKKDLRVSLDTKFMGNCFIYLYSAPSTNDVAKRSLQRLLSDGATVITDHQTFGRGTGRRKWISTHRDLTFTLVLQDRPGSQVKVTQQDDFHLETIAGIAIAASIQTLTGLTVSLNKNGIYVDGCKLGGIFIERFHRNQRIWYAIGLCINCNSRLADFPNYLQDKMTTIRECTGKSIKIAKLLGLVLKNLENIYFDYLDHGASTLEKGALWLRKN